MNSDELNSITEPATFIVGEYVSNDIGLGLEVVAALVLLLGSIVLWRKSKNLGVKLMIVGFAGAALYSVYWTSYVLVDPNGVLIQSLDWLVWEVPYLGGGFSFLASIGFCLFVRSLKSGN